MTNPQLIVGILGVLLTFAIGLSSAVWVLSNRIADNTRVVTTHLSETKAELTAKISSLDRSLAVLQTSETARDEKIGRMWDWWMQALTEGWTHHMRTEKRPSGSHKIHEEQ